MVQPATKYGIPFMVQCAWRPFGFAGTRCPAWCAPYPADWSGYGFQSMDRRRRTEIWLASSFGFDNLVFFFHYFQFPAIGLSGIGLSGDQMAGDNRQCFIVASLVYMFYSTGPGAYGDEPLHQRC